MNKRIGINIGLFGLIVILAYILGKDDDTVQQSISLTNINSEDIIQIKVLRKNLDDFEFNKEDNKWLLSSPQQFRASASRINAMLSLLTTQSFARLDPNNVDLSQLGLDDPVIIIRFNDHEFKFGKTDAIDQRRYVLYKDKIHLTDDFLYQQLMTNVAFFADPKLLPEKFEISSIQYPENKIELINGEWQLRELMDISPDKIKQIIYNWKNATAISASKYDASIIDKESIIKLTSANNEVLNFIIVSTEPHLILGRKDLNLQYHMGSDEAARLLLKKEDSAEKNNEKPVILIN